MSNALPEIIARGTYLHVKSGNMYEVIGVAIHSETAEQLVVYKPLYESTYELFVRPYEMFTQTVEVNGKTVSRFEKIDS